ncbi:MAG: response regulator, partial [Planctomycetota bacterium]|nr:response regulator [Planctomycetota bacterium]
ALTAHAMRSDQRQRIEAGCDGYLTKPIQPEQLLKAMSDLLLSKRRSFPQTWSKVEVCDRNLIGDIPDHEAAIQKSQIRSSLPCEEPEYAQIVLDFLDRFAIRVRSMDDALSSSNFEQLAIDAHWLKGTGGTAGFPVLSAQAESLYRTAKAGQLEAAHSQLRQLHVTAQLIGSHETV